MANSQVVVTRLYKPVIREHYVYRGNIIEQLEKNRLKPLTLVIAPTGYGKSVTISQWLDYTKSKNCWVSLDADLNDLRFFLLHFTHCIIKAFPESLQEISELINSVELPSEKVIANYLINELDEIGEEIFVVLDDYHLIDNPQIHDLLNELLKHFPRNLHLIIISRRDPLLKLSSLKSFGEVNEIRMTNLIFNREEIFTLAELLGSIKLNNNMIDVLLEKTEGWIVGLRLALLSLKQEEDVEKAIEELKGNKHFLTEYLLNEVFLKAEHEVQNLLLVSSLFERFNEKLLNELLAGEELKSGSKINSTVGHWFNKFREYTLFVIPLDNDGNWFRFHHFFRDFLQKKLDVEYSVTQINELHIKSAQFFDNNELNEEALKHAILGGDEKLSVEIFEKNKYRFIETDQFERLHRWLEKFPKDTVERHLNLLLTRAFLYDTLNDFISMKNDLTLAEKFIFNSSGDNNIQNQLLGEFYAVSANCNFYLRNFEDTYHHSKKALELLPKRNAYLRDYTFAYKAFSLNAMGKFNDAILILKNALSKLSASESISRMRNLIIQSLVNSFQGNLPEIMRLSLEYHSICLEKSLWVSLSYSSYYLSAASYEWNNLDEAVDYASTIGEHYYSGRASLVLQTLYTKAFALNALGKVHELDDTVSEIKLITNNLNKEVFNNFTRAFEVELSIRQNNIAKTVEIANTTNFNSFNVVYYFYFPQITLVKLLMLTDKPGKIAEAEKRVIELIELGRGSHRYNILMQALLLQSLLFRKKDNIESAINTLKEAIKLAEPGGFIRIFIDHGEPIQSLLEEIYKNEPDNAYISKILDAFKNEMVSSGSKQIFDKERSSTIILNGLEKISGRETNILQLISEGYRNQEIADQLYLSIHSIKKSLQNIYQKLDVGNRVAAINKAKELGLINPQ